MSNDKRIMWLAMATDIKTTTHACGGGEWSIEIYDGSDFLFELVGSNGTRNDEEADDLWGDLEQLFKEARKITACMPSLEDTALTERNRIINA